MKRVTINFPTAAVAGRSAARRAAPKAAACITKVGHYIRLWEGQRYDLRVKEDADRYFRLAEARSRALQLEIGRSEKVFACFRVVNGRIIRVHSEDDRRTQGRLPQILKRLALSDDASVDSDARTIDFVFSTSDVASDTHRIMPGAWQSRGHDGLKDFRANPVFLWGHDTSQPAIGKVTTLTAQQDGRLTGTVLFAEHPFADNVYQLYRGGFMRGASVSFEPLDWNYASGPDRAASARDFTKVKLWEISAVPLPADSSALAAARARGRLSPVIIDDVECRRRKARAARRRIQLIFGQCLNGG